MQHILPQHDADQSSFTPIVLARSGGTGGIGTEALRHFYSQHFIPRMPADIHMTPTHRSIGPGFVVDEFNLSFTHSVQMDWMLPGLAPTGRSVRVPFVVVVKFEGDKVRFSACRACAVSS